MYKIGYIWKIVTDKFRESVFLGAPNDPLNISGGPGEEGCGIDLMRNSPAVTPQHRGSICVSHKSSPHPYRFGNIFRNVSENIVVKFS